MFCPNCGTNNEAGTAFCENCGAPLNAGNNNAYQQAPVYQQPPAYQQAPVYQQPITPAPKKSNLLRIIGGVVLAVAVAAVCYFAFGESDGSDKKTSTSKGSSSVQSTSSSASVASANRSAENAALAYMDGLVMNDPELMLSSFHPDYLAEEGFEESITQTCEDTHQGLVEQNIVIEGCNVIYQTSATASEEDDLLETYGWLPNTEEVKIVTVRIERTRNGESETQDMDLYIIKCDGAWYAMGPVYG